MYYIFLIRGGGGMTTLVIILDSAIKIFKSILFDGKMNLVGRSKFKSAGKNKTKIKEKNSFLLKIGFQQNRFSYFAIIQKRMIVNT